MQYVFSYWIKEKGKEWEKREEIIPDKEHYQKRMEELTLLEFRILLSNIVKAGSF